MAKIVKVVISCFEYEFSKKYNVSVVYKSGVTVSYTRDSYEKIPSTVRNFVETNKKSERNFFDSVQDVCSITSFIYEEIVSGIELTSEHCSDDCTKSLPSSSAEIPNDNAFREICVNCRSCIHFRKCLDSDRVYFCCLESDSPYHVFACETDSNIECRGKYLDCHQNESEYFDYPEPFEIPDDDMPF